MHCTRTSACGFCDGCIAWYGMLAYAAARRNDATTTRAGIVLQAALPNSNAVMDTHETCAISTAYTQTNRTVVMLEAEESTEHCG